MFIPTMDTQSEHHILSQLEGQVNAQKIPYNFHIFEMKIKHDCQHVMCLGYNVRPKKGQETPKCIENLFHHSQLEFL